MVGFGCLLVGLYGTASGVDRAGPPRWAITVLGWVPFSLWLLTVLTHAWRNP